MQFLDLLKYIGSFLLVIGAIFIAFYFLKKSPIGRLRSISSENLKFLTQISLGPKKYLIVVQFLNKILLIGVTESQITLLGEADKDEWFEKGSDFKANKGFNKTLSSNINSTSTSS